MKVWTEFYTNWSSLHYRGGRETHTDGGRLTEVYKSLEKIKTDYSLNTVDAIMVKHQTTHLKLKSKSIFHLRGN